MTFTGTKFNYEYREQLHDMSRIQLRVLGTLEMVIMRGMSVYPEEERQAAELLNRAISTSSDKGVVACYRKKVF